MYKRPEMPTVTGMNPTKRTTHTLQISLIAIQTSMHPHETNKAKRWRYQHTKMALSVWHTCTCLILRFEVRACVHRSVKEETASTSLYNLRHLRSLT